MSSPRIRCGVAGVGSLGQHHARIYASLPTAELVGIFEMNDARAAEICARHNCRRFATIEELGDEAVGDPRRRDELFDEDALRVRLSVERDARRCRDDDEAEQESAHSNERSLLHPPLFERRAEDDEG